ncbi:UbiA family prenyltransferase [Flavobacteriales bacterium]|jgi:4-hydroxybenzoate polyprenyltransferase|nr:UbiA family prenyltransferase [Flavobacteriales bacterium]
MAILSIARWYNIFLITLSLYAIQIFIFENSIDFLLKEKGIKLHLYVLSVDLIIIAGYLINAFYDFEKDMINHPQKTYFNRIVSKNSCLNIYILCNILGVFMAFLISTKVLIFSISLIIALWIYSHKLRKKVLFGEISASLLTVSFFLGIALLNSKFNITLALFSTYIFTIDLTREIVKKMISLKGDLIVGEKSIPIYFGIKNSKYIIFFIMISSLIAILSLLPFVINRTFSYYFILSFTVISYAIYLLHHAKIKTQYENINTVYKFLIGLAIFSIVLY